MADAYKKAGVDIHAGAALVDRIKPMAKSTLRPGADGDLGGFGGLFDLKAAGREGAVLVAGADGVGTKLKVAIATGQHDTIGVDLVAMCANDVLAQGAEPLFFLDYFATGSLDIEIAAAVVSGIAEGCRQAGCALIGGETAEMPGVYQAGDYDLAGFCVGAVDRDKIMPRVAEAGDILIGVASSGPHSNGYSLIRRIIEDASVDVNAPAPFDTDAASLGAALLEPTRIYVRSVLPQFAHADVRGFAHITGGGLSENVPRMLPAGLTPRYDDDALALPPVFDWLRETGGLSQDDMRQTFNCGVGGVLAAAPAIAASVIEDLSSRGEHAWVIGDLVEGTA